MKLNQEEIDALIMAEKRRRAIGRGIAMLIFVMGLLALKWWTGS